MDRDESAESAIWTSKGSWIPLIKNLLVQKLTAIGVDAKVKNWISQSEEWIVQGWIRRVSVRHKTTLQRCYPGVCLKTSATPVYISDTNRWSENPCFMLAHDIALLGTN